MSWDVFIQDLPEVDSIEDIPHDFNPKPIGSRATLIAHIQEVIPQVDFSDPAWGILDTDGFSIEFNLGKKEVVKCIALHVRGGAEAGACVADILKKLGLRALDSSTGEFFDVHNPEWGYNQWRAYRDKVVGSLESEN